VDRRELLADDPKLFAYRWLVVAFVVFPPLLVWWKEPHDFIRALRELMLFAFFWPLLLLVVLYFFRRHFLVRLIERGTEVTGRVTGFRTSSGKMLGYSSRQRVDLQRAQVAVRIGGEEKVVEVDVPTEVKQEDRVTLLVDPSHLRRAVLLKS
jgi:hypothetical protein